MSSKPYRYIQKNIILRRRHMQIKNQISHLRNNIKKVHTKQPNRSSLNTNSQQLNTKQTAKSTKIAQKTPIEHTSHTYPYRIGDFALERPHHSKRTLPLFNFPAQGGRSKVAQGLTLRRLLCAIDYRVIKCRAIGQRFDFYAFRRRNDRVEIVLVRCDIAKANIDAWNLDESATFKISIFVSLV